MYLKEQLFSLIPVISSCVEETVCKLCIFEINLLYPDFLESPEITANASVFTSIQKLYG